MRHKLWASFFPPKSFLSLQLFTSGVTDLMSNSDSFRRGTVLSNCSPGEFNRNSVGERQREMSVTVVREISATVVRDRADGRRRALLERSLTRPVFESAFAT